MKYNHRQLAEVLRDYIGEMFKVGLSATDALTVVELGIDHRVQAIKHLRHVCGTRHQIREETAIALNEHENSNTAMQWALKNKLFSNEQPIVGLKEARDAVVMLSYLMREV